MKTTMRIGDGPEIPITLGKELPTHADLVLAFKALDGLDEDAKSIRDERKQAVTDYVEQKDMHKDAFKLARKVSKLSPVERTAWFRHFDHYSDELGLRAQGELDLS
jgi:hypothetical protein